MTLILERDTKKKNLKLEAELAVISKWNYPQNKENIGQ